MHEHPLIADLRHELRETQHELQAAQSELLDARGRAERAERSAREAWGFARTFYRAGRQSGA